MKRSVSIMFLLLANIFLLAHAVVPHHHDSMPVAVLGELKAARAVSDVAYAAVVMFTNAYALLNPDRREAADLVKRMQEDLEYFRRYAMPDPHRTRDAAPDDEEPEQPVEPAE